MRTFLFQYISILTLLVTSTVTVNAQLLDSIQEAFKYNPKPLLKLEARNAFVTSSFVKMKSVKAGLNYQNKVRLGIGYSWMKSNYETTYQSDTVELNMGYGLGFFEYAFFQSKHWNLELPIQVGFGRISYKLDKEIHAHQWVPIWEPAMTMEYIFLKYFGVGFGAGYRVIFKSKSPIKEQFTSPIYIFKFKINFGDIYKDVKRNLD